MNQPIETPRFFSRFTRELPADPQQGRQVRQVFEACYSRVMPTETSSPSLLATSREMAQTLGLSEEALRSPRIVRVLSGNEILPGMDPYAACYGGHQFGNWAGQLGDGRAISLGELKGTDGRTWELQLKGAGPTPYSRTADGRAVLRSSVREFLCSEAMHHLGVPTTRALSLALTGDEVVRDMFYDGRPEKEPGAVVCRVSPTFLRFGNFEIFASRGDEKTLRELAAFSLRHFFPDLVPQGATEDRPDSWVTPEAVAGMFSRVARWTAEMITHWMRVGFVHGVMNTDNMSLLGLTIDYGPYGWLEDFDPGWTPNTTDAYGRRYRFGNQPRVAEWNLVQFANSLVPLVGETAPLEEGLRAYGQSLAELQADMMAKKLGLSCLELEIESPAVEGELSDRRLVEELHDVLSLVETDMTIFYRNLAELPIEPAALEADMDRLREPLEEAYYAPRERTPDQLRQIDSWLRAYVRRSLRDQAEGRSPEERRRVMQETNPRFVLRNYLAQLAIDAATAGDVSEIETLLDVLRRPYDEQPGLSRYAQKRPEWARSRPGCSMLSCSS